MTDSLQIKEKLVTLSPEPIAPPPEGSMERAETDRRGGGIFFVATFVSQASALLRYVVMARILGPEQLGLAATLLLTGSFFDLISDTGGDRFLIQDRDGDKPRVQGLVQLVYVARGFICAALLVVLSIPIAHFYKSPELARGLVVLAVSPLVLGFMHLDVRRAQRRHDFRPNAICMIASDVAAMAATVIAAVLTRDFTAVLYGVIVRSSVMVVLSHWLAERRYSLAWDREHAPALARFAAPLMLNGLMLYILSQGDRVVVGNQLGPKALGYYSAIILLIFYPTVLVGSYLQTLFVPMIAASRDVPADRDRVSDGFGGRITILGICMAAGFALVTPLLVPILFGGRFTQPALLIGLIGILQTSRFLLAWPTTVALGMGRSVTVLISNIANLLAFVGGLIGLSISRNLIGLVSGFVVGEIIAVAVVVFLFNRDMDRPRLRGFDRLGAFGLTAAAILAWNLAVSSGQWPAEVAMLVVTALLIVWIARRESVIVGESVALARRYAALLLFRSKSR
jgi:O-antigen/teichoic acid export membrane protein